MRKSLTAALAVCCAACGAEDNVKGKSAYEGFYVGAGLSYQNNMYDVEVSDNLGDTFATALAAVYAEDGRTLTKEEANASAKNAGIVNFNNHQLNRKNNGKIGGTSSLGYGQFVYSNLYLGIDFSLDISGKSKSVESVAFKRGDTMYGNTTVQSNVIIPTLALKVGGYVPDIDTLVCVRAGAARIGMKAKNELLQNEIKLNKITPIVGLSIEKIVGKDCSVRMEGDYRFPVSKKITGESLSFLDNDGASHPVNFGEKIKSRSYNIRLMYIYHF